MTTSFRLSATVAIAAILCSAPAALAQQRQIVLGGADARSGSMFTRIVSVRELSDGRVLIADRGEKALYVFDWTEAPLTVGREGRGPGEYSGVGRIYALRGDTSVLIEAPMTRVHLVAGAQIVRSFSPATYPVSKSIWVVGSFPRSSELLGMQGIDNRGRIVGIESADTLLVLRFLPGDSSAGLVARVRGIGPSGKNVITHNNQTTIIFRNPLGAIVEAVSFADGWTALVYPDPYRVDWIIPGGSPRTGPVLSQSPPVTRDTRCAAIRRMIPNMNRCDPDQFPGWPARVPAFLQERDYSQIHATPGGNVLVERLRMGTEGRHYDIVDRAGRIIATLSLPATHRVVGFGRRTIYITHADPQTDLQSIHRHSWGY